MSVGTNPFISSPYGNPNFNPVKIGTRSNTASESKSSKVSKPQQDKQNSSSANRYNRKKNQNEGKIAMQIEEEEDLDDFSIKHVAAARYLRNHRLINEIFGDTVVPDVRSVVTTARMNVLKKQVQSLTMHQKKLESELQQIEEKFNAKKRKFIEASEQFQEEMKKLCSSKPVDPVKYQKMVEQAIEQLKLEQQKQRDEMKRKEEDVTKKTQLNDSVNTQSSVQQKESNNDQKSSSLNKDTELNKESEVNKNNDIEKLVNNKGDLTIKEDEKMDTSNNVTDNHSKENSKKIDDSGKTESTVDLNNDNKELPKLDHNETTDLKIKNESLSIKAEDNKTENTAEIKTTN